SVTTVLSTANWGLAGNYLADWISYEIRPDIEIHEGYLTIAYSKFSELGRNPNPEWVVKETATIDRRVETAPHAAAAPSNNSSGDSFMAPGAPTAAAPRAAEPAPDATTQQTVREEAVVKATVKLGNGEIVVTPDVVTVTRDGETVVLDIV